jgi:hypothetical protein
MSDPLDREDLENLARVAEGRGSTLAEPALVRLMRAGLVQRPAHLCEGAPRYELTPAGLAWVRSSDQ